MTLLLILSMLAAQPPELRSWVRTASTNVLAPEVHSVRADDDSVYIESAGLSLHSFGALEANQYEPPLAPRARMFRVPRHPRAAGGEHMHAPLGVIGVFVTGVPIYNPIGTVSFRDQNLWHYDAVRMSKAGVSPLVAALEADASRHSPIIGYALDGYPIYGPYGWDDQGRVRRMRSSYQLRKITHRTTLPDGTLLTAGQEGPDVSAAAPLGTFAEDYEYVARSGDLDQSNGRFTRTPDYPEGTYAYFLSTWPYLIGERYHGDAPLAMAHDAPRAGVPATLTFTFKDAQGRALRFLEKVHEQPIHMVVVSGDLAEFAHIHPQPAPGDVFTVTHTFPHGGTYTAFADYTAPGVGPAIQRTEIHVAGETRPAQRLAPDTNLTKDAGGVRVTLGLPAKIVAGADLPLSFTLSVNNLEPYLGAWAHIMLVSEDRQTFIHAHPLEAAASTQDPTVHVHAAMDGLPSPSTIRTITGFRKPGLYKLWFQFQRNGAVETVAWVLRVDAGSAPLKETPVPASIYVKVSSAGFEPSRLTIPANRASSVAFTREDAQNCASEVVFPDLGIRKKLPPGETVVIELPPLAAREIYFGCGTGMFRGALVAR